MKNWLGWLMALCLLAASAIIVVLLFRNSAAPAPAAPAAPAADGTRAAYTEIPAQATQAPPRATPVLKPASASKASAAPTDAPAFTE